MATAPSATRWGAIVLILFAGSVGAAQIGKLPGALPSIRAELGIGLFVAGLVISAIVVVGATGGMVAGMIADRVGHRRVVLVGTALMALGSLAGARVDGTSALIATRVVEGVGYIALIAAAPALVVRAARSADRGVAFGIWSFYMPFGMAAMVALSPMLMAGGWRGLWTINGCLAAAAFFVLLRALRGPRFEEPQAAAPFAWQGIAATLSRPGPLVLALSFGAYSLVYLSAMSFLPTFLIETRGMATGAAAALVGLAIFMNAPGCLAGGWMIKKNVAPWAAIGAGYAGMAVCAFGLYLEDIPFGLRYALALALPFFGGFIPPTVLARAEAHAPSPALYGMTVGLIVQVISIGQLIGPPVLAALVARSGDWQSGAWLTVGACATGFLMALALRLLDRRVDVA